MDPEYLSWIHNSAFSKPMHAMLVAASPPGVPSRALHPKQKQKSFPLINAIKIWTPEHVFLNRELSCCLMNFPLPTNSHGEQPCLHQSLRPSDLTRLKIFFFYFHCASCVNREKNDGQRWQHMLDLKEDDGTCVWLSKLMGGGQNPHTCVCPRTHLDRPFFLFHHQRIQCSTSCSVIVLACVHGLLLSKNIKAKSHQE